MKSFVQYFSSGKFHKIPKYYKNKYGENVEIRTLNDFFWRYLKCPNSNSCKFIFAYGGHVIKYVIQNSKGTAYLEGEISEKEIFKYSYYATGGYVIRLNIPIEGCLCEEECKNSGMYGKCILSSSRAIKNVRLYSRFTTLIDHEGQRDFTNEGSRFY